MPQITAMPPREPALAQIAAQLSELAAHLHHVATEKDSAQPAFRSGNGAASLGKQSSLALARHAYWLRRQRAAIFGGEELFGEPAWDILLDLYIAHAENKQVSVSSACIGSASPPTTGLRWLTVLAEKNLIARQNDVADHRRIMVRLTDKGVTAVERFLALAQPGL